MICVSIFLLLVFLKSASCVDVVPHSVKVGHDSEASQPVATHSTVPAIKKRHVTNPVIEIRSPTTVHPAFAVYQNAPIITRVYQATAGLSASPVASLVTKNYGSPSIAVGTTHPAIPVLGRIYHPSTVVATGPTYGAIHATPAVSRLINGAVFHATPATVILTTHPAFAAYKSAPAIMRAYQYAPGFSRVYHQISHVPTSVTQIYQASPQLPTAPVTSIVTKYATLQAGPTVTSVATNPVFTRYQTVPAFMRTYENIPGLDFGYPPASVVPPATAVSKLTTFFSLINAPESTKFVKTPVVTQTLEEPPVVAAAPLLPTVTKDSVLQPAPPVSGVTKYSTLPAAPAATTLNTNAAFTRYLSVPAFMSSYTYTPDFGIGYPTISLVPPATAVSKLTTFASLNNGPQVTKLSTAPVVTQTYQDPPVVDAHSHFPLVAKDLISQASPPVPTVTKYSTLQGAPAAPTVFTNAAFTRYQSVPAFMSSYEYTPEFGLGYPTLHVAPPATAVSKLTTFASLKTPPEAAKSTTVPIITQTHQDPQAVGADSHLTSVSKDFIPQAALPVPTVTKYSTLQAPPAATTLFTNAAFTRYQSVPAFMSSNEYTSGFGLGNPTISVVPPETAVPKLTTFASLNNAPEATKIATAPVLAQTYQDPQIVTAAPGFTTVTKDSILEVAPPVPAVTKYSTLPAAPAPAALDTNAAFTRYQSVPAFMSSNEYTPGFGLGNPTTSVVAPETAVSKLTTFTSLNNVPEVTEQSTAAVESQAHQDPPDIAAYSHLPSGGEDFISQAAPPVPTVTKHSTLQAAPAAATVFTNAAFTRYQSVPAFMSSNEYTPGFGLGNPTIYVVPPETAVSKLTSFASLNNAPEDTKFAIAPVVTQTYQDPPGVAANSHLLSAAKDFISQAAPPVPTLTKYSTLQAAPPATTVSTNAAFTRYQSVPGFMSSYEYTPEFVLGYPTLPVAPPGTSVPKLTTFTSDNTAPEAAKPTTVPVVTQTYQDPLVVVAAPALPTVAKDSILEAAPPVPILTKYSTLQTGPAAATVSTNTEFTRYQSVPAFMRSYEYTPGFDLSYPTDSLFPPRTAVSKLETFPSHNAALGVTKFTAAQVGTQTYQLPPVLAGVPPLPTVTKYSALYAAPGAATVSTNAAFTRYQSVPAFMRSYQYTPGFGQRYRTVSTVPPALAISKLANYNSLNTAEQVKTFNAAPVFSRVYHAGKVIAPTLPPATVSKHATFQLAPTAPTIDTSTEFERYQSVPSFMRSYQYSPGFEQGRYTVSTAQQFTVPSKLIPYTNNKRAPGIVTFTGTPVINRIYQTSPVVAGVTPVPAVKKYSTLEGGRSLAAVARNSVFARYQSVPAFMRSYQYIPGFGRGYHTVSMIPPGIDSSKISTYTAYNAAPVVRQIYRTASALPKATTYSSVSPASVVTTSATNQQFPHYETVTDFTRSGRFTPGFGRNYHTVAFVPPATAISKVSTYGSYNPAPAVTTYSAAPVVRPIYRAAPAVFPSPAGSSLTKYSSFQSSPAVSTVVSKPAFARYQSVPAFMSSYHSTFDFGHGYHTISIVPPATAVSKLSTYASYNAAPAVTTYPTAPVVRPIYHAASTVPTATDVSSLTKYSSFQPSKPAFARYQSVPAFMSSYPSTYGYGRNYHIASVVPPVTAVSKLATYGSYNTGPAINTYISTPVVRPIHHAAPAVLTAAGGSSLSKYSSLKYFPAVPTLISKPAFTRYQSVPAFMSSYQSTPSFGREYHTVSVVPAATVASKLAPFASYNPTPGVTTYTTTPVVRPIYHGAPAIPSAPGLSRLTKYSSFQSSKPAFPRYQSVPAFMSSYQSIPGSGRSYHSVSVVPPEAAVSKLSTYASYNPAPEVRTYTTTPVVRPIYHAAPAFSIPPAVSSLTKYSSFQSSKPAFVRYQSVPAFMSSYHSTRGYGRSYRTVSVVPPAAAVSKLSTYSSYNPAPAITTYSTTPVVRPIYRAAPAVPKVPAVSNLYKYSFFQSSEPLFARYQSVPAFMSSYQSTPRFGSSYHTVSVVPPATAVSKLSTYASYNPAPAVGSYTTAPAVRSRYQTAPVVTTNPAFSRLTGYASLQPASAGSLVSRPPVKLFQSVPASRQFGRGYHTVSVVPPTSAALKVTSYSPYKLTSEISPLRSAPPVSPTYEANLTPPVRHAYRTTLPLYATPTVSRVTKYSTIQPGTALNNIGANPVFARYQYVPAFMRSYQYTPGFGQGYHTASIVQPASSFSKITAYGTSYAPSGIRKLADYQIVKPIRQPASFVATAPAISGLTKYSNLQGAPAIASVSTNSAFARYQSVPAFMRSYQYAPGFGQGYHTISVVPPASAAPKLKTYASFHAASGVNTYAATPVPSKINAGEPAVATSPALSSVTKYSSTQTGPAVTPSATGPAVNHVFRLRPVIAGAPHVPSVTQYSSLQSFAGTNVFTDPAFVRYHSAPAVMRAYNYVPGFTRFYNSRPIESTPVSASQPRKHISYSVAPALTTYNTVSATSPVFQTSTVTDGVTSVPRVTALQPPSYVAGALRDQALLRYQSAPAVMRAYQYAPGFTRFYHSAPTVASVPVVSQLTRHSTVSIAPAVTISKVAPAASVVAHHIYPAGPGITQVHPSISVTSHVVRPSAVISAPGHATLQAAPALSSVTKSLTFHSAPVVSPVISHPAFVAYQSAPFITRIYHTVPVVTRIYYSVPLTTVGPVISYRKSHNVAVPPALTTVQVAPSVSIFRSSPITATDYGGSSVGAASPVVATILHDTPTVSNAGIEHSSTHVTVNSAPAANTAHAPAVVSNSATQDYEVGALGFGDGLPTYGHNYAYGLDGLNYRDLLQKRK